MIPAWFAAPAAVYSTAGSTPVIQYTFERVNSFPHDPEAFTQGLLFLDNRLYESTGQNGASSIREIELTTGKVVKIYRLPDRYFGEGLTVYQDKLIQLTWLEHTGFIHDRRDFRLLDTFRYETEGWGLTADEEHLIMSDGGNALIFLDPRSFAEVKRVAVHQNGVPLDKINELELIDGQVFANIWKTNIIAIINPATGEVTGKIDLTGLLQEPVQDQATDVLNGIAYDAGNKRLYVTGKRWPKIFEIRIRPSVDP